MSGESQQVDVSNDGKRDRFNKFFAILSTSLGVVCLGLGIYARVRTLNPRVGHVVVAAWVLCPPIFFWCDWVFYASKQKGINREVVKQTYDLSRNIWVALTVVLAALFHITWPK